MKILLEPGTVLGRFLSKLRIFSVKSQCGDAKKDSQPPSIGVRSLSDTKHSTLAVSESEDAKNAPSAVRR